MRRDPSALKLQDLPLLSAHLGAHKVDFGTDVIQAYDEVSSSDHDSKNHERNGREPAGLSNS
jgi:hypothetical protein